MSNTTSNTKPRPGLPPSADAAARKGTPLATGFLHCFPDALDYMTMEGRKFLLRHTADALERTILAKLSLGFQQASAGLDRRALLAAGAAAAFALSELVLAFRVDQDGVYTSVCTDLPTLLRAYPLTCAAVAWVSKAGNDQPPHEGRSESTDYDDRIVWHLVNVRELDTDGQPHAAKLVWCALAALQIELERDQAKRAARAGCV
jgi:hypothetical protein